MLKETINEKSKVALLFCVLLGILLRFFIMSLGHNWDFESYCVVGEIAGNFRNVYAETSRYNYGFIFFCIQGLLYRISIFLSGEGWEFLYRVLMVMVLTCTDLGIAYIVGKRHSSWAAVLFLLNPVSIIITGYHNQFDNIAILFALLSSCFYNEKENFSIRDIWFIVLMSFSLIIKHVFFLMPAFILLKRSLPIKKRICYAIFPPMIFLISFAPCIIGNEEALNGVLNNVFLYRSFNNAPLLRAIYSLIGMPSGAKFYIYVLMMLLFAFCVRGRKFEEIILLYMIGMVSFSSAIANQYLSIPLVALCVLEVGAWRYIYTIFAGIYLVLDNDGLGVLGKLQPILDDKVGWLNFYMTIGYSILAWVLLLSIVHYFRGGSKKGIADINIE